MPEFTDQLIAAVLIVGSPVALVARLYAQAIQEGYGTTDWELINAAIIRRFGSTGLRVVKGRAWADIRNARRRADRAARKAAKARARATPAPAPGAP